MEPYYYSERDNIVLYLGDCREILPTLAQIDHVITDPPYARDVYRRIGFQHMSDESKTRRGIHNHQYSSTSIAKMAAGEIGDIDDMLDGVAAEIARITRRWALVFSDVETIHRWRSQSTRRRGWSGATTEPSAPNRARWRWRLYDHLRVLEGSK